MAEIDRELLNYIANVTRSPLDEQISFFNENVDKYPDQMISCVRGLAEATVTYLYYTAAKTNTMPGPYWCLIFKSNDYKCFANECDKNKKRGRAYPEDYEKMWEANQLLKTIVPETFIFEANSVKRIGNMVLHNNQQLANSDLPREARKCLDSYNYLLSEVNRVVSSMHGGAPAGTFGGTATGTSAGTPRVERAESNGYEHTPKKPAKEDKGGFDVKKWFAGVQADLARERAKTQEDYDMEDND